MVDTPDLNAEPWLSIALGPALEVVTMAMSGEWTGANQVVRDLWEEHERQGIFALCTAMVFSVIDSSAKIRKAEVIYGDGQGYRSESIDAAPPHVRAMLRFVTSVVNDDLDTGWAVVSTMDEEDLPTLVRAILVFVMDCIARAQSGNFSNSMATRMCDNPLHDHDTEEGDALVHPGYFTVLGLQDEHGVFLPHRVIPGNYETVVVHAESISSAGPSAINQWTGLHPHAPMCRHDPRDRKGNRRYQCPACGCHVHAGALHDPHVEGCTLRVRRDDD